MRQKKDVRLSYSDTIGLILIGASIFASLGILSFAQRNPFPPVTTGNSQATQTILGVICQVFNTIKSIIFILGLTLMILGGAIFAGANLMPSEQRGGFKGYGMSMIMGGIIGVAIAVAAPFILNVILRTNPNAGTILSNGGNVAQLCTGAFGGPLGDFNNPPTNIQNTV